MLFTPEPGLIEIGKVMREKLGIGETANAPVVIAYDKESGEVKYLCSHCGGKGLVFVPYKVGCQVCEGKKYLTLNLNV